MMMTSHTLLGAGTAAVCLLSVAPLFAQTGPSAAVEMETIDTLPGYTIYRPLEASGPLPLLVWGNGSCMVQGNRYAEFLSTIAAEGYFVVSMGGIMSDEDAQALVDAQPEDPWERDPYSTEAEMLAVLDWAAAEASRSDSTYGAQINAEKVGLMGHSCGGLQAVGGLRDPRVATAIGFNTGTFPEGSPALVGADVIKETLPDLKGPVAYISGDPSDIAFENAGADYDAINHVPAFWGYPDGVGHGGTYFEPEGGQYAELAIAWFDWQLKGDDEAARWFVGDDCTLCADAAWTVSAKGFD
jgi:hypothetical protein